MLVQQDPGTTYPAADEANMFVERAAQPTPGLRMGQIGQMFLRRVWLVVGVLVVLNGLAVFAISRVTPRYTAEASLIIGPRQAQVMDMKAVMAGLTGDTDVIESELQMLRSRRVAREVAAKLELDQRPEFNPAGLAGHAPTLRERIVTVVNKRTQELASLLPAAWRSAMPVPPRDTEANRDPLARATDVFLTRLYVAPKGRSRVIGVSVESADPVLAAAAANAVTDSYIDYQLRSKLDATEHAHKWLDDRVREMREQVINADQAVEAYRQKVGIMQGRTGTLLAEQSSELGEKIMQAHVNRATAEARLKVATAALASPRGVLGLPEVQNSPEIVSLRNQESALMQRAAELSRSFGESYPKLAAVRAQMADVQSRMRQEVDRAANNFREDVRTAAMREDYLKGTLANLRQEVGVGMQGEIELRALQHEAEADRALYDRLLARSKETSVESGLQQPDAQIISRAEAPELPSFPNPALILPIFFITSLIVVVLLVFALEQLDHGFSTLEQVEGALGVTALGVVPWLGRSALRRQAPESYILEQPDSQYSEGVRSLYTSLLLSGASRPPKVVLLASALPNEGKTTTALSLARLMASCGKRVAMVDCDLRRPSLHKAFGVAQSPGLTDFLSGGAELADVLWRDTLSDACLIAAGAPSQTAPDLFASDAMRKLIAALSKEFDLVVLDSAPVLAVSDTRNLARLADKIVFVVRWQMTRRLAVQPALRQMIDAGGNVAGVLLSMVDLRRYAKFGDRGFYHRQIRLYLSR